jgi:DNA-binding FadR family transcriptional regulator
MTEVGVRAERQRLYREVADRVPALIAADRLKPGQRLPFARMLAEWLHVARSTLHEAMIALEIKGEIAFRAASMADCRQLRLIERTIGQMERADAADGHRDADRAFPVALVETLRNEPMRQLVEQFWAEMTSPLFIRPGAISGLFGIGDDHALQHHRRIFDAPTRRFGPAAKAAIQAYLFEVRKILLHDPAIAELTLQTDSR